jgi:hypothetical protein
VCTRQLPGKQRQHSTSNDTRRCAGELLVGD